MWDVQLCIHKYMCASKGYGYSDRYCTGFQQHDCFFVKMTAIVERCFGVMSSEFCCEQKMFLQKHLLVLMQRKNLRILRYHVAVNKCELGQILLKPVLRGKNHIHACNDIFQFQCLYQNEFVSYLSSVFVQKRLEVNSAFRS